MSKDNVETGNNMHEANKCYNTMKYRKHCMMRSTNKCHKIHTHVLHEIFEKQLAERNNVILECKPQCMQSAGKE